ncbi:GntR family transcriptional regulator [Streptomyces sp. NBC_01497]|uniref:GntR family transcriptional regulator n=1 Tax=Streptomyces sp. NBC_01497 TaxID=2903885 RepID=UPI003FCE93E7
MTLQIEIDPAGVDAPYEQLRSQIADRVREGALPVGYKLPTVRGLASDLGIAANTVAKAYRVLETDGVIETRGRNGTFVAAAGDAAAHEAAGAAAAFARRARRLGLSEDEAREASDEALRAAYGQRE